MQTFLSRLFPSRKKKCLAFVLSGGGARGAFQVGALQALLEAGRQPDLLVGTSIGAANAAFLAIRGFNEEGIAELKKVWQEASSADLLPSNYLWLTARSLFGRQSINPAHRMRDFLSANGLKPELRFADLHPMRLLVVSADLNSGLPVSHGLNPEESVLEGVLASTALPPWVAPVKRDRQYLVDGGMLSNLPVEPALAAGATEITAIDLVGLEDIARTSEGFGPLLEKLMTAVELRQVELELALAAARGVPTLHIRFEWHTPIPLWDFTHTQELIEAGYHITRLKLLAWNYRK